MDNHQEDFQAVERIGLVVWLHSMRPLKQLKRHGHIHYVSRKMKYAYLYCDLQRVEEVTRRLESINAVKYVEQSMKPYIKTEYQKKGSKRRKERRIQNGNLIGNPGLQ
ncbi:YlbG family protein [Salisediminibacterium selenitireducens]|uniref:Uncharacterized protein family UPF0298 n=1 Tax=Bacillus selenitireducens (strain ATCC 700615 / DSM 15326 / MLS10) TaxID=439292 RepID=D6XTK6_BACIE|nr:YlbG family protein [Salisediminibacterium selenitireducens]ADH99142.1 Uncharacterized protein family UPF0298 [[Bacillus] selenitireducens MLS10]